MLKELYEFDRDTKSVNALFKNPGTIIPNQNSRSISTLQLSNFQNYLSSKKQFYDSFWHVFFIIIIIFSIFLSQERDLSQLNIELEISSQTCDLVSYGVYFIKKKTSIKILIILNLKYYNVTYIMKKQWFSWCFPAEFSAQKLVIK